MKNLGIIVEYNPFHNGHLYHLKKAKEISLCENTIAVMSGNFVQRGQNAIVDKYKRTEMALNCGVDMVIELPTYFACQSAEYFAKGSIWTLEESNIISDVVFGSECGDINILKKVLMEFNSPDFNKNLRSNLKAGYNFPKARELSVREKYRHVLKEPNNILSIEYLKYINKIKAHTIKRKVANYHDIDLGENISSATSIRNSIHNKNISYSLPKISFEILSNSNFYDYNNLSYILHFILNTYSYEEYLFDIMDLNFEIYNKLKKAIKTLFYINDIINYSKSKNYTYTRLSRVVNNILLGIKKNDLNNLKVLPYIRVLGVNKNKIFLLNHLCKSSNVPVVLNLTDVKKLNRYSSYYFDIELQASKIYRILSQNQYNEQSFIII
ncbi:MAG: nucleotidyltransferase family protein [Lachnospirales bacterium]